jgi:hypothetical protein
MNEAIDQLNALLQPRASPTAHFPPTSRYATVGVRARIGPDGEPVVYLLRRFVPQPSEFATLGTHRCAVPDRPDLLAHTYLGDPEQFWRLCDANGVMNPPELTETGRVVRITLPQGIRKPATTE